MRRTVPTSVCLSLSLLLVDFSFHSVVPHLSVDCCIWGTGGNGGNGGGGVYGVTAVVSTTTESEQVENKRLCSSLFQCTCTRYMQHMFSTLGVYSLIDNR